MTKPLLVGLTGPSCSGKSTVSEVFVKNGVLVIDCDKVAREVTAAGSDCCMELSRYFPECFDNELSLDRKKMADIIFSNGDKLSLQNKIIFKYITREVHAKLEAADANLAVLDAPTLFQSGLDSECFMIVSVLCDDDIRLKRAMERDKIDEKSARLRFSSQYKNEFFTQRSDIIIYNNGTEEELIKKAFDVLCRIREAADAKRESKT